MMAKSRKADEVPENLWALILAGEDGTGLLARTPEPSAEDRRLIASAVEGSLLRQALDRAGLAVPAERTVLVANRTHDVHLTPGIPASTRHRPRLLLRPRGRGTATDVLLAVHWIRRQQADATVVILPSDQVIVDPRAFMRHVVAVSRFVERHMRRIVIVGARPNDPDSGCGWIETAQPIQDRGPVPVWRVRSLQAAPTGPVARAGNRHLRNTCVFVARAEALLQAARRRLPEVDARLETAAALIGTRYEYRALEESSLVARDASFAEAVLAGANRLLSASRLPPSAATGRTSFGRTGWPPAPRGRFDGLVAQHRLRENVEACLTKTMSAASPWKAGRRPEIAREAPHGLEI